MKSQTLQLHRSESKDMIEVNHHLEILIEDPMRFPNKMRTSETPKRVGVDVNIETRHVPSIRAQLGLVLRVFATRAIPHLYIFHHHLSSICTLRPSVPSPNCCFLARSLLSI